MPRQRSARSAPSRPTVPARSSTSPQSQQQTRPAASYAAPATQAPHQAPPAGAAPTSQGPGLFGQMASTAAGVAIGSSVGHAIGGFFGGGGSSEAANPQAAAPAEQQQSNYYANQQQDPNCAMATKSFTNCMDEHSGNMSICGWYMDQLKACQAAASKY
ncbi:hypothetical protein N0V82_006986 [Gnomoniopsis sp. IMI 355080]|nr:hypothetical protein N0V82_006986 [Gnomoniopsis sp. IMI 355080]